MKKAEWNSKYFYGVKITEEEILEYMKQHREIKNFPFVTKIDGVMIEGYSKTFYSSKSGASKSFSYMMQHRFSKEEIANLKKSGRVTFEQINSMSEQDMIDKYIHEKLKDI